MKLVKLQKETVQTLGAMESTFAFLTDLRQQQQLELQVVRPPNGITVAEYAKEFGCSTCTAKRHLDTFVTSGSMKRVPCAIPHPEVGRVSRTTVYVPAK